MPMNSNFEKQVAQIKAAAQDKFHADTNTGTAYGGGGASTQPNPALAVWQQKKQQLEAQRAQLSTAAQYGGSDVQAQARAIQQQIDALGPPPPAEMQVTHTLGNDVQGTLNAGAAAIGQIQNTADQIRQTGAEAAAGQQSSGQIFQQVGNDAQGRAAPQLQVQGDARGAQKEGLTAAQNFAPNTAGAAGIRTAAMGGAAGIQGAAASGAAGIQGAGAAATGALGGYQASREGVNALQQFANGPTGPSAAEAMLRLQAARDKASALSRARSARGGPGAVNEAMKVAQAEGAAQSADTRGQLALVQAQESAARRGESLQALTSAGSLIGQNDATRLNALTSAGTLGLQSATAAGGLAVQGQTAAGQLGVQGQTAATQAELEGSAQKLGAIGQQNQAAAALRGQDIDVAKANMGAELQTMGLNDQQTQFFSQLGEQARQFGIQAQAQAQAQGLDADKANAQIALQYGQQAWQMLSNDQQVELQRLGIERGAISAAEANASAKSQQTMSFLGTLLMAGATVKSDRRAKHDIKRLRGMADALRKTPGSTYRYKDRKDGDGEYSGPMAQDLERTREFRGAVVERGGKKTVDTGRLVMSHHAALSDLQRQIDRMQKLGRGKKSAEA